MSAVKDFTLSLSDLEIVGDDLSRQESVVVEKDGTLSTMRTWETVESVNPPRRVLFRDF